MRMSRAFLDYARGPYRADVRRFSAALTRGDLGNGLRSDDEREPRVIFICDASGAWNEAYESAGISDLGRFIVTVFLEGALLAGVHEYDFPNYRRYTEAIRTPVYVEHHGGMGVTHPHVLLTGLLPWSAATSKLLVQGCITLLPEWAVAYSRLVKQAGAGERIVQALASDPDLAQSPYGMVPSTAMEAIGEGLDAARAVVAARDR